MQLSQPSFHMSNSEMMTPLDYALSEEEQDIPTIVRQSLEAGHAFLVYQPIVIAKGENRIAFHEGLIRVKDRHNRPIPAKLFMSNLEESELGRELDCASLRLGLQKLKANPRLRLSINMSARSMADGKWRRILETGIRNSPSVGQRLILEISEASAMNLHEVLIRFMAEMQPKGVCFALDDFGAGLIAFRHLKDFFFDFVKVDKCFTRDIDSSPDNQVMAEALINVAHQFEMFAVAEGVERPEEAQILKKLGADCLQGYYFGVPRAELQQRAAAA